MASEVVSIALGTIRDLLIEEAKFLSGVRDQVEEVQAELIRMQCFLKDADRRHLKDATLQNYVREIRHLAYRTENVLDKFAIEVESRSERRGFGDAIQRSACILSEGRALHKVGSEIATIKAKINSLTTSLQTYGVSSEEGQSSTAMLDQNQQRLRQTYSHQVEEYFVGMKDDIRQLVSLINDSDNRSHRVISIYGMGGVGKTTLARKIYSHIDVQRGFKAFAWATITQQFNTRTILLDILKQLHPNEPNDTIEKMEERELVRELYKVQKRMKCLVVLDDLWEIEDWKCLSPAFPFAETNSKVLITTRNQKLAEVEFPYALNFLSEDEGWELLQMKAFAKRDTKENDPKLEAVGRKIVRRCGKLPLAISVLGGILSQKNSLYEWEAVNKNVDSYIRRSEGIKEGYGGVLQVLALSYDELPYHLKPCFLHLGQFREDEEIDAEMLYLMWIAEGMVSSDDGGAEETLTDVAERYLYEMGCRSMVQVELDEFSTYTRVKSCYLHDLMRDFCMSRAKEVEFLKLLDFRGGKDPLSESSKDELGSPWRCSIYTKYGDDNDSRIKMSLQATGQFRSLLISNSNRWLLEFAEVSFPQVICDSSKFKYLRVLKFEGYEFKGKRLRRGIKKLIHLRFLSLKDCELKKVPSSIGQLQHLQTLDLRIRGYSVKLKVVGKLKRLRHLYLNDSMGRINLIGLNKLETLIGFSTDKMDEFKDVLELKNLRRLTAVVHLEDEDDDLSKIPSYLNSSNKLREASLTLDQQNPFSSRVVPLKDFFSCLSLHQLYVYQGKLEFQKAEPPLYPSNLNALTLRACEIEGDPMDFLGKLPNLKTLSFYSVRLKEIQLIFCDANAFPKLKSLDINFVTNLEKWVVAKGSMPNLSRLQIAGCGELEMIPDGLRFVTTLQRLEIQVMPEKFMERIEEGGADFDKICHVPSIGIF